MQAIESNPFPVTNQTLKLTNNTIVYILIRI